MKKTIALFLAILAILSCTPAAFAADTTDSDGSTAVEYTVENAYSVNIPEVYNLNTDAYVDFTPNYVHTAADKQISIYVMADGIYYTGNGIVYLKGTSSGSTGATMSGTIKIGNTIDSIDTPIGDSRIATFYGDNGEISYTRGPFMKIEPELGAGITCGEYQATVFFDIVIEDLGT